MRDEPITTGGAATGGAGHAPAPTPLPTRAGYDRWAATYDGDGNPLVALEERVVLPMIEAALARHGSSEACHREPVRVLDVGCGTGRHALRLAAHARGPRVTAMDFSEGMLAAARAKGGAQRVTFIAHDLAGAGGDWPVEAGAFDLVLCALVLDHVHSVGPFFAQLARAAAPRGAVLVTVMHPALGLRGVRARFVDPGDAQAVDGRVEVQSASNQVSDYVMGALRAGLALEHMSEHAADEELVRVTPRAAKHLHWPMLLVMRLTRGG